MGVSGIGRGSQVSGPDPVEGDSPAASAAAAAPTAAAPVARNATPAGASRMDVQRALAEKAAAASAVSAVSTDLSAKPAGGVEKNAKLRAAFDKIDVPASTATTYRMDRNVDAFASRWRSMDSATKSIDTTYFIWNHDVFGMAYMGHMLKKAKQGLEVRGMFDATADAAGLQGFKRGQDYLQELVEVNPKKVQFGIYNPVLKKDYTSLSSAIAANHDKLEIIDGKTVETGGRNMAAHYFSDPKDKNGVYRDTDIHVESPTFAASAKKAFEAEFKNDKVTEKVKPEFLGNWSKKDIELIGAYAMMDDWLKAPPFSDAEKAKIREAVAKNDNAVLNPYIDDIMKKTYARLPKEGITRSPSWDDTVELRKLAKELVGNVELRGNGAAQPQKFTGEVKLLDKTSVATGDKNEIGDNLVSLIDAASDTIEIHNPYVVLTDKALEALSAAGKRGVKVTFITNSPESTDSAMTQAFFLNDWPLIEAKIPGSKILVATGEQKHHSKSFVIDGTLTGVSTYNADWISARVNSEDVALEWSPEFAADTKASYDRTLADPAHGFVEYKIKRDADGRALLKDGKPIIEYGPENHVPKKKLEGMLGLLRKGVEVARNNLDSLSPLRHAPLDPKKDFVKVVP